MDKAPDDALEIFLQPGEFYFGDAGTRIRTLLGSCVSITVWHPGLRVGGMCHYLLPSRCDRRCGKLDGRYADEAFELFLAEFRVRRTLPSEYEVKLFGGGKMFRQLAGVDRLSVSERNVHAARAIAGTHGLRILAEDLGGEEHRNVIFDVWSGNVWVKQNRALELPLRGAAQA